MLQSEQLIQVDEKDNIIGQTTKKEAHENHLIHRVSAVYVFNHKGELLLQHRREDGLVEHSVGGHVRFGETYYQAAKRELSEELGIVARLTKVGNFFSDREYRHYFTLFKTKYDGDFRISHQEITAVHYQNLAEIAEYLKSSQQKFTQGFVDSFNFYIKKLKLIFNNTPHFNKKWL